jgi:hypothetical protein
MPFKSEKQRRFLWLKHPDIAKRWAHEYPNQKNLPTYARETRDSDNNEDESKKMNKKEAALAILRSSLAHYAGQPQQFSPAFARSLSVNTPTPPSEKSAAIAKKSISILQELNVPHSDKPVAAGEENVTVKCEKDTENSAQNKALTNVGSVKARVEKAFNLADEEIQPTVQKLARLFERFEKFSAIVRLGKKHRPSDDSDNSPKNVGLDVGKLQEGINQIKMQRAYALQQAMMFPPAGSDKKQQNPGPVATYAGTSPQVAANKPSMQSPAANPVGMKGPLNTRNGVPTFAQNLTGNASFGKGSA